VTELVTVANSGVREPTPDSVVFHDRPIPPEWEIRLREVSPISDSVSWLALRWFAEAQRWVLYECIPNEFIERGFRSELEGAHPDTLPDWGRIVSAFQWEMFKKYRVHARPCWVIQGHNGGHKVTFDASDQELCRAQDLPTEPPQPGDLPYAPFDERVVQQIIRMSKLQKVKNNLGEFKKRFGNTEGYKREFREALRAARAQYVDFINNQFEEPGDLFRSALRKGELEDAPKTTKDFVKENEVADESYIERGRF
jgi:hypothetical protein